jgi:dienelactone hydrolase
MTPRPYESVGLDRMLQRARRAANSLTGPIVYAGYSLGAGLAQILATTDRRAIGLLMFSGYAAPDDISGDADLHHLRAQHHLADPDRIAPLERARATHDALRAGGAQLEVFTYRDVGHLFMDDGLDDYDAHAAETACQRAHGFLDALTGQRATRRPSRHRGCR